eukprot:COSAG02_NODE_3761_length_6272_cov_5.833468_6_plen_90_part_00
MHHAAGSECLTPALSTQVDCEIRLTQTAPRSAMLGAWRAPSGKDVSQSVDAVLAMWNPKCLALLGPRRTIVRELPGAARYRRVLTVEYM